MRTQKGRKLGRTALATLALTLVFGLFWGVAHAGADSASPSPADEKTVVRVGVTQDADNLNPFIGYSVTAYQVYHMNYDLLVGYGTDGQPRPELAKSWTTSEDGLEWTFELQTGVTWQDGEPFTAADVAFTYNYILEEDLTALSPYIASVDKVVAIDDDTVKMYLSKPKPGMLRIWIPILPEHIWSKISGEDAAGSFQNSPPIVGTGPFQTVEVKKGEFIRMEANKDYWQGAPKIDEVIIQVYTNQDTMTMDLKSGAIDAAYGVPVAQFNALKNEPGITAVAAEQKYLTELAMNCYEKPASLGHPVLKDMKFRQAISWAVDKEKLVETCWGGYADVGESILVPGTDYAWTPSEEEKFGYDVEKAKTMLDEAGYTDSDGDGVREDKKGEPIKLRLWTREESPEQQRAGKLLAGSFESIGIEIDLTVMNDGSISDGLYNYDGDTYAPDYDFFIWGWAGNADPDYLLADFTTSQIEMWNDACWSNAEFDRLQEMEATENDPAEREKQVVEMQQIFYEEAPYAILAYPRALVAYNTDKWEGWVAYPAGEGDPVLSSDNIDTYVNLTPKTATAADTSSSSNTTLIVVVVVAAIAVVIAIVALMRRNRNRAVTE